MILLLAASANGAMRPRDTIVHAPSAGAARISSSAEAGRYALGDGSGQTVAIAVTAACRAQCTAADPQRIAEFLGSLPHGPEMRRLTVQLNTPMQLAFECGYGAQACYYPMGSRIVLSGDDAPARDGASREFVLAHEYGHHVAHHRESPRPFPPALAWGTPRWARHAEVCRRARRGLLAVGGFGARYFHDAGEAFAESFAHMRFPESGVRWHWPAVLKPDAAAFAAIRADTLEPWEGRTPLRLRGRVPARSQGPVLRTLRTPLDGTVSVQPAGPWRVALDIFSPLGGLLRSSGEGLPLNGRLSFTVCGQPSLRLAIRSALPAAAPFKLQIQRP